MKHDCQSIREGMVGASVVGPDFRLFKAALDGIGEAVVITGSQLARPGPVIEYVNAAFCRMTGYSPEEVVGKTPRILQGPLTDRAVLDRLQSDLATREAFEGTAINYRKNGTTYLLHWHITPLRNQAGELTHWVALQREIKSDAGVGEPFEEGVHRQITSQAAARLAGMARPSGAASQLRDRGEPDPRDLQMQVRDILAAVRSIARRTADTHETADDYVMHFDGRINTLARVKNAVVQTGGHRLDLGWLITQELLAFDAPGENRVRIKGPKIYLRARTAEIIGLGIHELATNALKFGAFRDGQLARRGSCKSTSGELHLGREWHAGAGASAHDQRLRLEVFRTHHAT
jgi:PAS domain S-box-containing protein